LPIIRGDARALPLVDGCVDCVVTSPPYFGLRDYGHADQIGTEATPEVYIATLVAVFREVRRVLTDHGTVWLNLGDTRQSKNLLGIPWRVAFALQADGWYLRADIIWAKPNPMPESVTDRPTKAHEYVFLLTKSERYWYDADAIKERSAWQRENNPKWGRQRAHTNAKKGMGNRNAQGGGFTAWQPDDGRNKRSVWTVPTVRCAGAHFATMPEDLVAPCILAGCPLGGLVLDPFLGSGTVGAVAARLGRRWVGTDLKYQDLSNDRTAQRGLFTSDAAQRATLPPSSRISSSSMSGS
jgi:DNA modification methylase